jgi:exopolyphosphatase / guanosine-5'-triphosphate,3'-diphosphate pyrophosphatase
MAEVLADTNTPRAHRLAGPAFAALDLGTNNCRMLVGTPHGEGFRVVDSFSRIVRLGEGLQSSNRLSEAAMERGLAALSACADRLARRAVRAHRAIATEACRRAVNGAEFLARVRAQTGLNVDVIAPREEAELAVESCAPLLRGAGRRAILFDIGGGSTEIAWMRLAGAGRPELIGYQSLPAGVVTLAERFGAAATAPGGFETMVAFIVERLAEFERIHCIRHEIRQGGVALIGTSGTVTTLASVALGLQRYRRPLIDGAMLDLATANAALAQIRQMGVHGLAKHPCVGPDRAEFVLPGCAIYAAIAQLWPAETLTVADRGLREGMLLRLIRADRRHQRHA